MSAVSKRVIPASSAAPTTAAVSLRPMRMPKLLQPRPTTLTFSEPIVRVSTGVSSLSAGPVRADRIGQYCTGGSRSGSRASCEEAAMAEGAVDTTLAATPDEVWAKVGQFGSIAELFPAIESFRLEGDDRVIGMFGMEIRE